MARKIIEYVVQDEGRDLNKTYVITEMPARAFARWSTRALTALVNAGMSLPDNIAAAGIAGVAAMGFGSISKLRAEDANALMDDLIACVRWKPDPVNHPEVQRPLLEDEPEEVATYFTLVKEVFNLHVSFSQGGGPSTPTSGTKAA